MSSSEQRASELPAMGPSEPITIGSTMATQQRAEKFKDLLKVCEKALSLPSAVGYYTCTILVTLFEISYKVDDVSATLAAALIRACRKHKTRRFLSEILAHLSAPMTGTLTVLWDLEHLDVNLRTLYSRREITVTCEESAEPHAFSLTEDGSVSKVA